MGQTQKTSSKNKLFGGSFSAQTDGIVSEINITPLVDVVLVLLIIFMITAPAIYQSAIKVELPKAVTGETSEKSKLSFTLSNQGVVYWNDTEVNWSTLGTQLSELKKTFPDETALISADDKTPHGSVVKLMDALRQSGFNRFAMSVESSGK